MEKKFKTDRAGFGFVYFEDKLITADQIAMLLNDGFEKTIELDKCYDEIKDKEKIIAEKFDYRARIISRLVHEHYELGKNVDDNVDEMQKIRDIIDYIENLK